MSQFKPMLAGKAPEDLSTLKFPLALSPKLDGIRAIVKDGIAAKIGFVNLHLLTKVAA